MSVVHISTNMLVRVNAIKSYCVEYMPMINNCISWQRGHRSNCACDRPFTIQSDVIMGAIASQITSLTLVYSTVYSGTDQRIHQSSASLAFVRGIHRGPKTSKLRVNGICEGNSPATGEFPAQKASNAENVSIWWRHHGRFAENRYVLCITFDLTGPGFVGV